MLRFARNDSCGCVDGRGEQVCLDGVLNEREVAAGFTIAIDKNRLAFEQQGHPFGDHSGIGAVGVLAWTKDVEVAQTDGMKAITFRKHVGVKLVDVFRHGVGAQGFADVVFHLGQSRVVAIGAAAGGVGEAFDLSVAGGHQHVQKAGDVGAVGGDGVGQAAGHAAQGGLVEDVINTSTCALAVGQLADVALNEVKVSPLLGAHQALNFVQVVLVAGGKVVQAHHALVEFKQGL